MQFAISNVLIFDLDKSVRYILKLWFVYPISFVSSSAFFIKNLKETFRIWEKNIFVKQPLSDPDLHQATLARFSTDIHSLSIHYIRNVIDYSGAEDGSDKVTAAAPKVKSPTSVAARFGCKMCTYTTDQRVRIRNHVRTHINYRCVFDVFIFHAPALQAAIPLILFILLTISF